MNPLLVEAIGSILRALLQIGAGWLVARGVWTNESAEQYVGAAALALISIGWAVWQHSRMRVKLLLALGMAGASENKVQQMAKDPAVVNPPVSHPKGAIVPPLQQP